MTPYASSADPSSLELVAVDVVEQTRDIRSVELAAPDGRRLPSFTPGSHLVVDCGPVGSRTQNSYSLTGPSIEPATYAISVLRQPSGRGGSSWIHDHLRPGTLLRTSVPRSAFPPVLSARHHLLVAGGVGITAMISHVRAALQWNRSFTLIYAHRAGQGAHLAELRRLCGERLVEVHGRAATRRHLQTALAGQPLGTHVYTCGPVALIDTVEELAGEAGWPPARVHAERFSAGDLAPGRGFTARLARSGRRIEVPVGTSLLEALETEGVEVANRCRQGVCGECRLRVLAGRVEHRDHFLTPTERTAGDSVMACVSRCEDDTLELDL